MRYEKLIDHTGIADPIKRTIPAEKPTAWENLANEAIADSGYWKAETRKAQAHAAKLAEALRDMANIATHPKATLEQRTTIANEARQALEGWEGAQS